MKELILQCLNIKPEDRPTAEQLIINSFIVQYLNLPESSLSSLLTTINTPRLSNLPVQVYSTECIDIIIEKLVDKIFDRHSFDQDLRVEQIWEESNRRHLAIALGMDYNDLVTISLYIYIFDLFSSD